MPIGNAINKSLTLRMNQASVKRQLPRLIEHIPGRPHQAQRRYHHRFALNDIADAYHMFSSKLDNIIKPVLVPGPGT